MKQNNRFTFLQYKTALSIFICSALFCFGMELCAQEVISKDELPKSVQKRLKGDSASIANKRVEVLQLLELDSYLSANVAPLNNDTVKVWLGNKWKYTLLPLSAIDMDSIEVHDIELQLKKAKGFVALQRELANLQKRYQNIGYAFFSVATKAELLAQDSVTLGVTLQKGHRLQWDELRVITKSWKKTKFVNSILGFKQGRYFSQKEFEAMSKVVNSTQFMEAYRAPKLFLSKNKASPVVYVKRKPSNRLDGLVGLQQDEETNDVEVNGFLNLQLFNAFSVAEELSVTWSKTASSSQNMTAFAGFPYLFRSNWGFAFDFTLSEIDSSYSTVRYKPAFSYSLSARRRFSVYYEKESFKVIIAKANAEATSAELWGLGYQSKSTNDPINPRTGWITTIRLASGQRKSNTGQTLKIKLETELEKYIPMYKKWVGKAALKAGWLHQAKDEFTEAELFRVGGFSSLRGFYEQEFITHRFGVATAEVRYLFEAKSHFAVFYDLGLLQGVSNTTLKTPMGFGAGAALQVAGGQLTMYYSLGRRATEAFSLGEGKLHFGYISVF